MISARSARVPRALAPYAAMIAIGAIAYPSTGTDDSYITYWASYALARFGSIVNVNGDRVEQSSSLLWTLALAFLSKLSRVDVESLGVPLSVLTGAATIWATGVLARRTEPGSEERARWLIALCFPSLLWSFSGMETALAAFLWTACAAYSIPYVFGGTERARLSAPVAALTGFLLVRPEAPFVAFAALASLALLSLARRGRGVEMGAAARRATLLLLVGGAAAALIAVFRHAYFGAWMPQPVHAKVPAALPALLDRVLGGLLYVVGFESVRGSRPPGWLCGIEVGLLVSAAIVASSLGIARFVTAPRRSGHAAALGTAVFFLASLGFVVVVGGDWMGGWRFLCTPLPCAVALVSSTFSGLAPRVRRAASGLALAFELLVLSRTATAPGHSLALWFELPTASRAYPFFVRRNISHLRDAAFMPEMRAAVRRALASKGVPVTLLSGQAGYLVYQLGKEFFGQMRFVDRVSLVTRDLENCPLLSGKPTDVGFSLASTEPLFDPSSQVHETCGLPMPDIVFDNGRRQLYDFMMRSGRYDVIFEEGTEMLPPGAAVAASRTYQYLAIRSELWRDLRGSIRGK
jgi:hypothetical protein